MIANDIKEKIQIKEQYIKKVEVVGGYLNFYICQEQLIEEVLKAIDKKKNMENQK